MFHRVLLGCLGFLGFKGLEFQGFQVLGPSPGCMQRPDHVGPKP